ncbi:M1 family metallopeptidase [Abyssisolibacter fermentans]|uniref:M1 family metallopeptidase n=1 Tax=Abyssisolibacter fermentans TaxID=1766203 RepID=UPI0008344622|nr:M1 family metallopeptidase [Abyssisolibacter fermentans]
MKLSKSKKLFLTLFLLMLVIAYFDNNINNNDILDRINNEKNKLPTSLNTRKDKPMILAKDYNGLDYNKINSYNIDVHLLEEEKKLKVKQKVKYFNNENIDLSELFFHIYPNVYKTKRTAPSIYNTYEESFPNGFSAGYIKFQKICINNKKVNYYIQGIDDTILKIKLSNKLKKSEFVVIDLEYEVFIPCSNGRFGYDNEIYNFGNWYPIAAVYDDNGWNLDPYYNIGDPFYSDTSNYYVNIYTPKNMVVASSGDTLKKQVQNNYMHWEIKADFRRDFAFVASRKFLLKEKYVDGILIKCYLLKNNKEANEYAVKTACNSIRIFNKVFGLYPFKTYSVVATNFPTGMEYPAIVFISQKLYDSNKLRDLEIVIVHETAHQWWYSAIGNDEIDEPWLDESLTTYSEVIYFDEMLGEVAGEKYFDESIKQPYDFTKSRIKNKRVLRPLSDFNGWLDYDGLVYNKGAIFIHEIEKNYGESVLYNILKKYYKEYKFHNATSDEFLDLCQQMTNHEFKQLVDKWLYN